MTTKRFETTVIRGEDGIDATGIAVPFDPRAVFGRARVPVVVEVNGHAYRSTICTMKGVCFVPLAKVHRLAAGVDGGARVEVCLTLDVQPRRVEPPTDLARALSRAEALQSFEAMSFTHQKEHVWAVEEAKRDETRRRRIDACVEMVKAWAAARTAKQAARKAGKKTQKKVAKEPEKKVGTGIGKVSAKRASKTKKLGIAAGAKAPAKKAGGRGS